jgi:hypothetical protein
LGIADSIFLYRIIGDQLDWAFVSASFGEIDDYTDMALGSFLSVGYIWVMG